MGYQNRLPPEGINVVERGWQRDFWVAVAGFIAGAALLIWLLIQLAGWAARWTPFHWEQRWAEPFIEQRAHPAQPYLQDLADRLAEAGGLDEPLNVTVHYRPDTTLNAYATLGGHVFILQGLLDTVESEQGLAFVLAHEIAHIQERHPVRAMARELSFQVVFGLLFGRSDAGYLVGMGGQLAMLEYSRDQEYAADAWALEALYNLYGHTDGAYELFHALDSHHAVPQWLTTHPETHRRIARLESLAQSRGWHTRGPLIPLPEWPQGE
ncbi:M48 family metallopeptidase [Marinimicrobium alkaliphilum]|uniref:M48 family metallopeptidase n=1 Tax=Marinimicrobium alkaliphilum TaxID=2202654 RepID=UPI000DBA63E0|nr:M48 family metallopeptidase [Marinimicrobium alkaliphilum]